MEQDGRLTNCLRNRAAAFLAIIFGLIFSIGIGSIHLFDLDELYFAEITREMMLTRNYGQITFNFEQLYEKPPLFFWIQAASMHLWGINEIGARFPNVVCGLLTIITLYYIGKAYKGKWFGLLWMCLHATAFLPHFYFKSGIIDPFLNYFLLLAIYFLSRAATENTSHTSLYYAASAGLCIGLALLAKGPIGAIIPFAALALSSTWVMGRIIILKQLILTVLVAALIVSCWLIPVIWYNDCIFIQKFIQKFWEYHWLLYHQPVDTHNQPWYYHYLVLFFGCFPSSLFTIAFCKQQGWMKEHYFAANMQAVLIIVLLIFTWVGTKIVHYSSMAYFPITFFAADFLYRLISSKENIKTNRWIAFLFIIVGMVIGSCLAIIPWIMLHKELCIPFITNPQIMAALHIPVRWNHWDSLPGIMYIIGVGIAFYYLSQHRMASFICISIFINMLTLTLFLSRIAPKIESYTQKAVVDFCKKCKEQDVYLTTIGFKAAAPLFYTNKTAEKSIKEKNVAWILTGPIDKPCFFIVYKNDAVLLENYKDIHCIKEAGCFSFYERLPKTVVK
ncbi:ArnT family glycosyltransferase [Candidatus Cardinium hertigii]|jgi:4-amino-4-deoxy-L-arabinose transferase-like glycosyltransferase|uniref:Glycosyltransferase family 39 protein n=1 Tax=Candidatus Cardinium hertigii TaxID=247481 RepID=A0A3N2QBT6_9BACT|nr:glycosyltransferase family 39 protein [Candidatus Cardinium hertigii]ROT47260.1 glycosyltransferase family 39 protein [Candidatus Cardinium hertigii]